MARNCFGVLLAFLLGATALAPAAPPSAGGAAAQAPPESLVVGSVTLHRCAAAAAYCGSLERALDPSEVVPGLVSVHFEFYPHTNAGAAAGTLVATEGGPGYPATLSRDDYLALLGPLRAGRDLILMDNRGTGLSAPIDCPALQAAQRWTVELVAACGRALGDRAPFYGTAFAADDLAAILGALQLAHVDLYGDSYGTYFAQVFALRHGDLLRSLVLDGAYPLNGPDYPWYPNYAPAMRDKFNLACERFPACRALAGDSVEHILPALAQLRAAPFPAQGRDADGEDKSFTADAAQLATVMFAGSPAFATVRELDAAARAFSTGDRLPLLRLMAETVSGVDSRDPTADPRKWSAGLAAAVMCQDPPQIFDMHLAPDARAAERERIIAARQQSAPETYAPFTIDEYRAMPLDYSFLDQCVAWPAAALHAAGRPVPEHAPYPDVPVLVISGELDNMTTVADGAAAARAFKRGRQVVIANSFHVNALPRARSACGAEIAREFIQTLSVLDSACAARVPALRLVPQFARHAAELAPAMARAGNRADEDRLRVASAALQTLGDVLARVPQNSSGSGKGLRGGSFLIVQHGAKLHVSLYQVRWTEDVAVSGAIERAPGPDGEVLAHVKLNDLSGFSGDLEIRWHEGAAASAQLSGRLGDLRLEASAAAP
jgi:pimeloyl-ACP methyl ester carboxylesterase